MSKLTARANAVKAKSDSPWKASREREYEDKRMAVLQAAAELFVTRGYYGTTLSDVAERLNVTKPAIYYYFGSKDAILLACTRMGLDEIERYFGEHDDAARSGRERLEAFMRFYARSILTPFGMCLVRVDDLDLEPETRKEFAAAKRSIYLRIRQLVTAGVSDGSVAPCDPRVAAFTVAGALGWLSQWFRPGGALSVEEAVAQVTALLIHGLAPRADVKARRP